MSEPSTERTQVASRLRQAREYAGLSQGQVAKLLQMHRPTISEIEAGRRHVAAEELGKFARVYDVSVSWLLDENDDMSDDERATMLLAARELAKLKKEHREAVIQLLRTLRGRKGT